VRARSVEEERQCGGRVREKRGEGEESRERARERKREKEREKRASLITCFISFCFYCIYFNYQHSGMGRNRTGLPCDEL
jgi:hypothetical protein